MVLRFSRGRVGSRLFKRRPNNSIFSFLFAEVSAAPYLNDDLAVREYYPSRHSSLRPTIIPAQIEKIERSKRSSLKEADAIFYGK